jgi:hypothetical protein
MAEMFPAPYNQPEYELRPDPALTRIECEHRAITWFQRWHYRKHQNYFPLAGAPQWVIDILHLPNWQENYQENHKRFECYRVCASFLQYKARRILPKEMVMGIRCAYPDPNGNYTGYIHTALEDDNQEEEEVPGSNPNEVIEEGIEYSGEEEEDTEEASVTDHSDSDLDSETEYVWYEDDFSSENSDNNEHESSSEEEFGVVAI